MKAVWVYSRSKKDPGAFKARLVMQGFLMQQGMHYNDVHAQSSGHLLQGFYDGSRVAGEVFASLGR